MKPLVALLLATLLSLPAAPAQADGGAADITKLAVTSLIGDVMTVDTYRKRVGSTIDSNSRVAVPVPGPVFDYAALETAQRAASGALPSSSVEMLAVPAANTPGDPALVLDGGQVAADSALIASLKDGGFSHLLLIGKLRAPARLRLERGTTGSGTLEGIGFYVDHFLRVRRVDTGEAGEGFIGPYVYIQLTLVDLQTARVLAQRPIMASASRSAARNPDGVDPWGAMTAEQKVSVLQRMIRTEVAAAVPQLLLQQQLQPK